MNKTLFLLGFLSLQLQAQQAGGGNQNSQTSPTDIRKGRVGINTEQPATTLDITKALGVPNTVSQGVLFPRFTTEERGQFTNVAEGTMIYNTVLQCLEIFKGLNSGGDNGWHCYSTDEKSMNITAEVVGAGFTGEYKDRVDFSGNTTKFRITNTGTTPIVGVNLTNAVSIINGNAVITAVGQNADNINIDPGQSKDIIYVLRGTPAEGTLTANFRYQKLLATQSTNVKEVDFIIRNHSDIVLYYKPSKNQVYDLDALTMWVNAGPNNVGEAVGYDPTGYSVTDNNKVLDFGGDNIREGYESIRMKKDNLMRLLRENNGYAELWVGFWTRAQGYDNAPIDVWVDAYPTGTVLINNDKTWTGNKSPKRVSTRAFTTGTIVDKTQCINNPYYIKFKSLQPASGRNISGEATTSLVRKNTTYTQYGYVEGCYFVPSGKKVGIHNILKYKFTLLPNNDIVVEKVD